MAVPAQCLCAIVRQGGLSVRYCGLAITVLTNSRHPPLENVRNIIYAIPIGRLTAEKDSSFYAPRLLGKENNQRFFALSSKHRICVDAILEPFVSIRRVALTYFKIKWLVISKKLGIDVLLQRLNAVRHHQDKLMKRIDGMDQEIQGLRRDIKLLSISQNGPDKGTQQLLTLQYQALAKTNKTLPFSAVEFRNFSQFGEDGILHYIFSLVGVTNSRVVEMCAGNGIESNSANLIVNHGWNALLVDGDESNVKHGRAFFRANNSTQFDPPQFLQRWINRSNVNTIIQDAGFSGEIDLLSLDMDGVDYWIWDAISVISPRVVLIEINLQMGDKPVTVPYSDDFTSRWLPLEDHIDDDPTDGTRILRNWTMYGGASLAAFNKLAKSKGYRLIGRNSLGFNAFFMRDDVGGELFPEISERDHENPNIHINIARGLKVLSQQELVNV